MNKYKNGKEGLFPIENGGKMSSLQSPRARSKIVPDFLGTPLGIIIVFELLWYMEGLVHVSK